MSLVTRLRNLINLIAALDRRTPHPERIGEDRIAADSAALRRQAVAQIAQIEAQRKPS
jgi:hypothetical protein